MENSMPMQFLSSFLKLINSMISHATHQIIRRIQSPDKELLVQQSTPHYMFRYIIIFDAS
jgi:hypothetical protein